MTDAPTPTTQNAMLALAGTILRKLLTVGGTGLATHGLIASNGVETFVSIGLAAAGIGWSFWNDYGRAIALSKLEVWKATAMAQADALHKAKVPGPTAAQIADKIPDPAVTAQTVTRVMTAGCIALFAVLLIAPAVAQPDNPGRAGRAGIKLPIDPLGLNKSATGDAGADILGALEAKLLPDLKYALNIANGTGNDLNAACWSAWIDLIEKRQKANVDESGNTLPEPSPGLITKFQKLSDIRNALQPTSPFMRACSPVANVVKGDVRKFIGLVLTGGVGLAAMGVGL